MKRHFMVQQPYATMNNEKGFITLLSVLIVGVVGSIMTAALLRYGIASMQTAETIEGANKAKAAANACAETGLLQLVQSQSNLTSGNLTLAGGTCQFTISSQSATQRQLNATGTYNNTIRKVQVDITINNASNASILTPIWKEVSTF